jgi:acetyltransferase-like isoleucine patch superfamily enzyme
VKRFCNGLLDLLARIFVLNGSRATAGQGSRVSWHRVSARHGELRIGTGCTVQARIDYDCSTGLVTIGDRTYIGASHLVCHTKIEIGDDVIISWDVTIVDHDSHSLDFRQRCDDVRSWRHGRKSWEGVAIKPVHIGNRAWIGFGATILKGVTIGEGAVVGAMSVVTRDVPSYCLVVGNPARFVRRLSDATCPSPP